MDCPGGARELFSWISTLVVGLSFSLPIKSRLRTAAEVDAKLHQIMSAIHEQCVAHGKDGEYINYVKGANIAGFMKVAKAMMAQGIV